MSDQHRADCLDFACRSDGTRVRLQTPHLRRLAESGTYFPRMYSEAPVCVPARTILQTGVLPHRSGICDNRNPLASGAPTLARALRGSGYFTQAIGKMHFSPWRADHGFHRMWLSEDSPERLEDDEFLQFVVDAGYGHVEEPNGVRHELYMLPQVSQLPETHHTTAWTARQTVAFLRDHATQSPEQPFFCWTSFQNPHPPFDPPVPWNRLYRPEHVPATAKSREEWGWLPFAARRDPATLLDEFPGRPWLDAMWMAYLSSISFVDSWIGEILSELERLQLVENTLVIYVADHGDMMGDHWGAGKSNFYESSTRVPGIVSWPGHVPAGVTRRSLAGLADILPTILDAAQIDPTAHGLAPDGISLLPAAREDQPTREVLFGRVNRGHGTYFMALSDDWKYMYAAGANRELLFRAGGYGPEHFDSDPELCDLLSSEDIPVSETREAAAIAAGLRETLQRRLREDGALDLLDAHSETGFRLLPPRPRPTQPLAPGRFVENHPWLRRGQYARWLDSLPPDWTPPEASPAGAIRGDLPLRSDRSPYVWPPI